MLKNELNFEKTLTKIAVLSIVGGLGITFFGELFLPLTAASLAALYLYDSRSLRLLSLLISAVVIISGIFVTIFSGGYSFILAVESVILALAINVCYGKNTSKTETVLYTTVIGIVFFAISLVSIPMIEKRVFSFEVVREFYLHVYEVLKQASVAMLTEFYNRLGEEAQALNITAADIAAAFDRAVYMLISLVAIISFAISGFSLKLFSFFVKRYDEDRKRIDLWQFEMPPLYAYFYMALTVINLFTATQSGVFAIAMTNLYNIFLYVYAYVGIKLIYGHFSSKHNKIFTAIIIAVVLLISSSLAVQILAMIGVFYSLYRSKIRKTGGE